MSTKWKEVKKKQKPRKSQNNNQQAKKGEKGKSTGKKQNKNQKKKNSQGYDNTEYELPSKPPQQRKLPIGMAGNPKLMKKYKSQKSKKGKSQKKKKYTNEEKVASEDNNNWFDPNTYTESTTEADYHYNEEANKNFIPKSLAEKIKKSRERKGYSRADFAEAINEPREVVTSYEMSKCVAKIQVLKKMSKVLGVSLGKKAGKKIKDEEKRRFYQN